MSNTILTSDLAWRLGWMLLHSVWQILFIWAVTSVVLTLLARRSASARYAVTCCGMAFFFVPLAITFVTVPARPVTVTVTADTLETTESLPSSSVAQPDIELAPTEPEPLASSSPVETTPEQRGERMSTSETVAFIPSSALTDSISPALTPWLPWIVAAWLAGIALLGAWNLGGWIVVQQLRRRANVPGASDAQRRLAFLAARLRITRPVRLVESVLVESPTAIGWLRPIILLPTNLLCSLAPAELDAILAHELAHVSRRDYAFNLLQVFTETVLFYHPAVWSLSRRIRLEREYCCDDVAIAVCGDKSGYVRALAAIEQGRALPIPAMSFFGRNTNMTLSRIRRILGRSQTPGCASIAGMLFAPLAVAGILTVLFFQAGLIATANGQFARPGGNDRHATDSPVDGSKKQSEEKPSAAAADDMIKVDLKQFRLVIFYHGMSDKPFYSLTLSVPPLTVQESPTNLFVPITEEQAAPIAEWLTKSGYFKRANVTAKQDDPKTAEPQYLLRVRIGDRHYEESLGWNITTLDRLDALRKTLGDQAAKSMDQLLSRLSGQRKVWESGEVVNGLQTTIVAEHNGVAAGRPYPIKIIAKNVSSDDRQVSERRLSGIEFTISDEQGQRLPALGRAREGSVNTIKIKPGESVLIDTLDIASDYSLLRRPGRYSLSFRGYGLPSSNRLFVEVTTDSDGGTDGDPLGRLLPIVRQGWYLGAGQHVTEVQPGANWGKGAGTMVTFVRNPPSTNADAEHVWIWLMDDAVPPQPDHPFSSKPETEHLGKLSKWNVYYLTSQNALKSWPTAKEEIKTALAAETKGETNRPTEDTGDGMD